MSGAAKARSGALIVATILPELEREANDGNGRTLGVDAYEDRDRIDLIVDGERIALTRYEAERLAGYLGLAVRRAVRECLEVRIVEVDAAKGGDS